MRYEVDYVSFSNKVYYIFDTVTEEYLMKPYESFDTAEEDCDILNEAFQQELATY